VYALGYSSSAGARNYAAPLFYPALFTMVGCAVTAGVNMLKGTPAY